MGGASSAMVDNWLYNYVNKCGVATHHSPPPSLKQKDGTGRCGWPAARVDSHTLASSG